MRVKEREVYMFEFESEREIPQWAEGVSLAYKILYQTINAARNFLGQRGILERQLAFDIQKSFYETLLASFNPEDLPESVPLEEDTETVVRPDILSGLAGAPGWEVRFRRILHFLPRTYEKYEVHHSETDASFFPFHETFRGFPTVRKIANQCSEKRGKISFLDAAPWTREAVVDQGLEKESELNTYEIEKVLAFFEKTQKDCSVNFQEGLCKLKDGLDLVRQTVAIDRVEKEREFAPQIRQRVLNFTNALMESRLGKVGAVPKWIAIITADREKLFFLTKEQCFVTSAIRKTGTLKQILFSQPEYEPDLKKSKKVDVGDSGWIRYGEYVCRELLEIFPEKVRDTILDNALHSK